MCVVMESAGFYFLDDVQDKNGWMALFCHSGFKHDQKYRGTCIKRRNLGKTLLSPLGVHPWDSGGKAGQFSLNA